MTEPFREADVRAELGLLDRPLVVVLLTLPDGESLELLQTFADLQRGQKKINVGDPLPWMLNPSKTWPHPQAPITFQTEVRPGFEATAREWFASLTPANQEGPTHA